MVYMPGCPCPEIIEIFTGGPLGGVTRPDRPTCYQACLSAMVHREYLLKSIYPPS